MSRVKDVIGLIVLAAVGSTAVGAAFGATSLWLGGAIPFSDYWSALRRWWVSDALGVGIIASLIFTWRSSAAPWRTIAKQPYTVVEFAVVLLLAVGVSSRVFGGFLSFAMIGYPEAYLLFCLIIWSALRFSPRETITLALVISIVTIHGAITEPMAIIGRSLSENLFHLQLFMGVLTGTGMVLAAAINERKDALEKFKCLVESTPCAMIMVDGRGRIVMANPQTEKIFGYKREELTGRMIETIVPERFKNRHPGWVEGCFKEPEAQDLSKGKTFYGRRKEGGEVQLDIALSPVKISEGIHVLCSIVDVTERKRAEEAQALLVRAGSILTSSLDIHETLEKVARLTLPAMADWCVVCLEIGGEKRATVAHLDPLKKNVAKELANRLQQKTGFGPGFEQVIKTGKAQIYPEVTAASWVAEAVGLNHSQILQELGAVSYICAPLLARNRAFGAMAFISGESKRRYDSFHLALAEELARRAAMAIDNAHLYLSAQRAIRVRDEFLAVVSHDLKNPLFTIISNASVLKESIPTDDIDFLRTIADHIDRSARRMDRLIHDLLDLAKLEGNHLSIDILRQEAIRLIDEALALFDVQLKAKQLRVIKKVETKALFVLCDHDRILQVLSNLLDNAVKFTAEGGSITISLKPSGREIEFSIRDTGPGIPQDQLDHIFDRFWQAKRTRHLGAGLGLSIAQDLIRVHGGRIRVESRVGEGTTFFFTLMADRAEP